MVDQLSLFETPSSGPDYNLFLAIQPSSQTAQNIYRLAVDLRMSLQLGGTLRPLDHLHISLHAFLNRPETFESLTRSIDLACTDAARLARPFHVKFNQALKFQGSNAFVLAGPKDANPELAGFHHQTATALAIHRVPVGGSTRQFNPHLTLQYTHETIAPKTIEPIIVDVEELVLIRSEVGATKYTHLGRWKLGQP